MKKNFEYKEPEFKVVNTATEDVITTSEPQGNPLQNAFNGWEMGALDTFAI
jgi:hypothetical protein